MDRGSLTPVTAADAAAVTGLVGTHESRFYPRSSFSQAYDKELGGEDCADRKWPVPPQQARIFHAMGGKVALARRVREGARLGPRRPDDHRQAAAR